MNGKSVYSVVEAIPRYLLAVVACVSFAQFLLLLGVGTGRAAELGGATLARAILCGAIGCWWFYRARKRKLTEIAVAVHRQPQSAELSKTEPPSIESVETGISASDRASHAVGGKLDSNVAWYVCAGVVVILTVAGLLGWRKSDTITFTNTGSPLFISNDYTEALVPRLRIINDENKMLLLAVAFMANPPSVKVLEKNDTIVYWNDLDLSHYPTPEKPWLDGTFANGAGSTHQRIKYVTKTPEERQASILHLYQFCITNVPKATDAGCMGIANFGVKTDDAAHPQGRPYFVGGTITLKREATPAALRPKRGFLFRSGP